MAKKYVVRIVVEDFENLGPEAIRDCFEQMYDRFDAAPFGFKTDYVVRYIEKKKAEAAEHERDGTYSNWDDEN